MTGSDAAAVIALEARRCEAIGAGNLTVLAEVLADDYLHVLAHGQVIDKLTYIDLIRSAPRTPRRGTLRVRMYGDAAVITGDLDNHLGTPGQVPRTIPAFCTQVACKSDGQWRFVSYILTRRR
ncbi:MAG TPA: nuclear transport factor 2 family protein [Polyangiales bacterium]|nr:nuclear transport factor 2 family protein [Polyangiales bacterium]